MSLFRSQKRRQYVRNASRRIICASKSGRSGKRSVRRNVTASGTRVAIVPMNDDDPAVASGSDDVTRRRLEIEQINVENISKTNVNIQKTKPKTIKQQLKLLQGPIITRIFSNFRAFCVPKIPTLQYST